MENIRVPKIDIESDSNEEEEEWIEAICLNFLREDQIEYSSSDEPENIENISLDFL